MSDLDAEVGEAKVAEAINLLVLASRVSPPLRDAMRVVEQEIQRLRWELVHAQDVARELRRSRDALERRLDGKGSK